MFVAMIEKTNTANNIILENSIRSFWKNNVSQTNAKNGYKNKNCLLVRINNAVSKTKYR